MKQDIGLFYPLRVFRMADYPDEQINRAKTTAFEENERWNGYE